MKWEEAVFLSSGPRKGDTIDRSVYFTKGARNMTDMNNSKTVTLPRTMPLTIRISEASRKISEWLRSLDRPFNHETDKLQLTRYERSETAFSYHYSIINRKEFSASDVNKLA
jgi:hypothetical protein